MAEAGCIDPSRNEFSMTSPFRAADWRFAYSHTKSVQLRGETLKCAVSLAF